MTQNQKEYSLNDIMVKIKDNALVFGIWIDDYSYTEFATAEWSKSEKCFNIKLDADFGELPISIPDLIEISKVAFANIRT
jgi:hypothetical protein